MPLIAEKFMRRRGASLRRRILFTTHSGQIIARKWPSKSKNPPTHDVKLWREFFRLVQRSFMYADQRERMLYVQLSRSGPWLPRDWWTSNMYRRLFYLILEDRTIYPVDAFLMSTNTLDTIAQAHGSLVFRGPDVWEGLDPGPLGYVLTSQGPDASPIWAPGGGSGEGGGTFAPIRPLHILSAPNGHYLADGFKDQPVIIWQQNNIAARVVAHGVFPMSGDWFYASLIYTGDSSGTLFNMAGLHFPSANLHFGARVALHSNNAMANITALSGTDPQDPYTTAGSAFSFNATFPHAICVRRIANNIQVGLAAAYEEIEVIHTFTNANLTTGDIYPYVGFFSSAAVIRKRQIMVEGFQYD